MIHARHDYDRIQDPALHDPSLIRAGSTPIAEDEPVVLFRAQDKAMLNVLRDYIITLQAMPGLPSADFRALKMSVLEHIERVKQWQAEHGCKTPDL